MDGGAGTDTLSLGIAMTAVVAAYVSNFETLEFGMTADLAQDMTLADGMNTVSVLDTAAATDDLTLTNVSYGLVLNMNGAALASTSAAGTADIGIVIATLAADTASDDITLNLSASAGGVTVGDFRPDTRYETVTVNSSGTATNQILTVGTAKNNIILAGATGLTLTGTGSLTGVVDASTMTGVFTTTTSTTALTVLGGSGNDVLNSGVVANTVTQTISGGAGNDTITSGNLAAGGTLTVNGDAGSDTITYNAANTGASIHNVNGGAGFDFITLGQHAGTLDDVISTATAVADADKITGFLSGTDDFDYNGTVSNDAATTITAVSNATFAGGLAADVDATVYIVTGSVTGAAATDLTALVAATTVDAIAAAYATFEASLATNLGTITGLDSTLGATESVLLVVDEGTNSIVLRLTNTSTATANTVIASELELVAIMVGNNDLVVGDFI
jgi:hypothetical protein